MNLKIKKILKILGVISVSSLAIYPGYKIFSYFVSPHICQNLPSGWGDKYPSVLKIVQDRTQTLYPIGTSEEQLIADLTERGYYFYSEKNKAGERIVDDVGQYTHCRLAADQKNHGYECSVEWCVDENKKITRIKGSYSTFLE